MEVGSLTSFAKFLPLKILFLPLLQKNINLSSFENDMYLGIKKLE